MISRPRGIAVPLVSATILLIGFWAAVAHYWFLIDDSFISFRYAQNLVQGNGLVWNPGERVEGYTNFLWVLGMAAGMVASCRPEVLSNVIGALSGMAILILLVWHSASLHGWRNYLIWLAPSALVVNRSFTAWSTGGLETQFFSFLVLSGFLLLIWERQYRSTQPPWRSSLILALASLTRPEGVIFAFWAGLCQLGDLATGRRRLRSLIVGFTPYAIIVGLHLLWRYSYYGAWLPNTYHAKVNGFWWEQSARYFSLFLSDYKLYLFAPILLVPVVWRRSFSDLLFAGGVFLYLVYVGSIGGDRFEFRFLVVILPYIYWLVAEGIGLLSATRTLHNRSGRALVVLAGLSLLGITLSGSLRPETRELRNDVNSVGGMKEYTDRRAAEGKALDGFIESGVLPKDLRVAVGGAGALPYYTRWYTLDYYGLNDVSIARQAVEERSVIGHEHRASVEQMLKKRIVAVDLINRMYLRAKANQVVWELKRLGEKIEEVSYEESGRLRSECFQLGASEYFLFATPLSGEEVRRALPNLPRCDLPGLQ